MVTGEHSTRACVMKLVICLHSSHLSCHLYNVKCDSIPQNKINWTSSDPCLPGGNWTGVTCTGGLPTSVNLSNMKYKLYQNDVRTVEVQTLISMVFNPKSEYFQE